MTQYLDISSWSMTNRRIPHLIVPRWKVNPSTGTTAENMLTKNNQWNEDVAQMHSCIEVGYD